MESLTNSFIWHWSYVSNIAVGAAVVGHSVLLAWWVIYLCQVLAHPNDFVVADRPCPDLM